MCNTMYNGGILYEIKRLFSCLSSTYDLSIFACHPPTTKINKWKNRKLTNQKTALFDRSTVKQPFPSHQIPTFEYAPHQ